MTNDATRATARALSKSQTSTSDALRMAMANCDQVENLIHAAWMAARSLDGDELPAGEALQAVIHHAGEWLQEVRASLRKAGAA